jgi:hypothetical protein
MTLNVNPNEIQIKNSLGQVKFTSNNKLVYQRAYQTGTVSLAGTAIEVPFQKLATNDFLVINILLTSSTGNSSVTAGLLNKLLPANGSLVVDFYGRNVNNTAAADTEWIGVDSVGEKLRFVSTRSTRTNVIGPTVTNTSIRYVARIWSFL